MATKATLRQQRYDADNTVRVSLKFNKKTDADIIAVLEKSPNKQTLIKMAIREFIKSGLTDKK